MRCTDPSPEQIDKAYKWWRQYSYLEFDQMIAPFLNVPSHPPAKGWIHLARTAFKVSGPEMARRLGVSAPAYCKLERNERKQKISMQTLAKVAEALDCELVYAIRPKPKVPFSQAIWQTMLPDILEHPWVRSRPQPLKIRALLAIARRLERSPSYRRTSQWTRRIKTPPCYPGK